MKKNICILLLLSLLKINCSYAQTHVIDSLNQLLQSSAQDSSRVLLLSQISGEYSRFKYDTALLLAEEGVSLARKIHFVRGEARCLSGMSFVLSSLGNTAKALQLSLEALQKAESIYDQKIIISALLTIGSAYAVAGDHKKSLEYRLRARELSSGMHDDNRLAIVYLDLGADYEYVNPDSAIYFTNLSYVFSLKLGDDYDIGSALESFGDIYLKMGKDSMAMNAYRTSIPYCIKSVDVEDYCGSTIGMAYIFKHQQKKDSSLYYAKLSYTMAESSLDVFEKISASSFLTEYYKDNHVMDSAFRYLTETVAAKDSLYSMEKTKEIQRLTAEETMRQSELADQKIKSEEDTKRTLQYIAIGVFIPFFFLIVVFLSRIKVRARVVEFLAIIGLLLLFEFITDLIFPYISDWTNDSPLWEMLILLLIAALLEPVNYRLEHWIKGHLVYNRADIESAAS